MTIYIYIDRQIEDVAEQPNEIKKKNINIQQITFFFSPLRVLRTIHSNLVALNLHNTIQNISNALYIYL